MTSAVSALQAALAAEDAAIYGYGVAGAHLSAGNRELAQQYWTGHRQTRDALTGMITALGVTPVAAMAYYDLPFAVNSTSSAMALAAHLEDGVTAAYLGLVAVSSARLRTLGAAGMQAAATRAAYWRGTTEPFPGLYPAGLSPGHGHPSSSHTPEPVSPRPLPNSLNVSLSEQSKSSCRFGCCRRSRRMRRPWQVC
jgi:hypothetical protein